MERKFSLPDFADGDYINTEWLALWAKKAAYLWDIPGTDLFLYQRSDEPHFGR